MINGVNRILVIGDAMIDTYVYGNVNRISPEAPVPIMCPTKEEYCLGGAANVAHNAIAMGSDVTVLFILGKDSEAEEIINQLLSHGVNCNFIITDSSQSTINKMRVIGNNQQITRIDYHDNYSVSNELEDELISRFSRIIADYDVVIISDYGKGTCTDKLCKKVIATAKLLEKPVIIDPKGTNWEKYRGASVITPNLKEINVFS